MLLVVTTFSPWAIKGEERGLKYIAFCRGRSVAGLRPEPFSSISFCLLRRLGRLPLLCGKPVCFQQSSIMMSMCVCVNPSTLIGSPTVIHIIQYIVLIIALASLLSFRDSVLAAKSWFRIAFPLVRLFLGSGPLRSHLGSFCACRLTRQRTFTWEGARGMHTVVRGTTLRACTRRSCSG